VSVVALLACALVAGLWVRSRRTVDWISVGDFRVFDRGLCIWSADGSTAISLTCPSSDPMMTFRASFAFNAEQHKWRVERRTYSQFELIGIADLSASKVPNQNSFRPTSIRETLLLPYWFVCAATGMAAITPAGMTALRRRRRRRRGLCLACGYDLRGTPSGACPECGTSRSPAGARPYAV
jgi:hypothetical protein